jgi:hypothetical protein
VAETVAPVLREGLNGWQVMHCAVTVTVTYSGYWSARERVAMTLLRQAR